MPKGAFSKLLVSQWPSALPTLTLLGLATALAAVNGKYPTLGGQTSDSSMRKFFVQSICRVAYSLGIAIRAYRDSVKSISQ